MNIREILANYSERISDNGILRTEDLSHQLSETKLDNVTDLKRKVIDFTLSGKLIRSSLCLLISQMYGRKKVDDLLDIAFAIELNHSGLLIHDDIMDDDNFRRGKPSIHAQYELSASALGVKDKENFGKNMAVCLGDICFFWSNILIENSPVPTVVKKRIANYYFFQLIKTGLGQMLDVKLGMSQKNPKIAEIIKVYDYKTGNYTFNAPIVAGYYSSGKNEKKEIILLEKIGFSLGIIFQITDDLIGFLKDKEVTGKVAGSDVRENKKTIIRHFMLKSLKSKECEFILECFGNKKLKLKDLKRLRKIFYERKIDKKINRYISKEVEEVQKNIEKLNLKEQHKNNLIQFVKYLVNRLK